MYIYIERETQIMLYEASCWNYSKVYTWTLAQGYLYLIMI